MQIGRDYAKGTPVPQIMEKYGVAKGSIYNIVRKKRGQPPTPTDKVDAVVSLNYRGYSDVAISKQTGIPQPTVHRIRTRMGLPVIPAGQRRA
jgi:hypothetical protein